MQSVTFSLGSSSEEIGFPRVPAAETPQVHTAQQSVANWDTLGQKCPKSKSCSMSLLFLPQEQGTKSFLTEDAKGCELLWTGHGTHWSVGSHSRKTWSVKAMGLGCIQQLLLSDGSWYYRPSHLSISGSES